MDGFVTISKPAGITSHDVVSRVRRVYAEKRVGHGGTLDPGATGVLVVGVGKGTRLFPYIRQEPKVYEFTLILGVSTDSLDTEGKVIAEHDASGVSSKSLEEAITRFHGGIQQVPPMYSAVHYEGRRLYELARQGVAVEREPRPVTIFDLELLDFTPGQRAEARIRCACSGGTYMRSLCNDIGDALEVGGHMGSLCRLGCGDFTLESAVPLDDLVFETPLVTMPAVLGHLGRHVVNPVALERIRHGASICPAHPPESELVSILDGEGNLVAVTRWEPPVLQPLVVVG